MIVDTNRIKELAMKERTVVMRAGVVLFVVILGLASGSYGEEDWGIHDMNHPRPAVIAVKCDCPF